MKTLVLVLALLILQGCTAKPETNTGQPQFVGSDVSDVTLSSDFSLPDQHGVPRKLADFKGKVVAMFFGYTHCPDVCPTTMADMANGLKLLGDRQKQVQVLFVTLDPERDTPDVLNQYVPSFHPDFLALRGDEAQTIKITQDFKVYFLKQASSSKAGYTIDHTAGVYVFDKTGKLRIIMKNGQSPKDIAHDLGLLL
jgi:protein SCO1/2